MSGEKTRDRLLVVGEIRENGGYDHPDGGGDRDMCVRVFVDARAVNGARSLESLTAWKEGPEQRGRLDAGPAEFAGHEEDERRQPEPTADGFDTRRRSVQ